MSFMGELPACEAGIKARMPFRSTSRPPLFIPVTFPWTTAPTLKLVQLARMAAPLRLTVSMPDDLSKPSTTTSIRRPTSTTSFLPNCDRGKRPCAFGPNSSKTSSSVKLATVPVISEPGASVSDDRSACGLEMPLPSSAKSEASIEAMASATSLSIASIAGESPSPVARSLVDGCTGMDSGGCPDCSWGSTASLIFRSFQGSSLVYFVVFGLKGRPLSCVGDPFVWRCCRILPLRYVPSVTSIHKTTRASSYRS